MVQHALLVTKVTNLYDMASKKYPQPTSVDDHARLIRQACALVARSAMERQGISKRDLARQLGVTHRTLSGWLDGNQRWDVGYVKQTFDLLKIKLSDVASLMT